ncbi:MAG: PAS domain S-box protein [Ginsengibacter sp.]
MKKRFPKLSSEWLLLLLYFAVFISLVILRNSQFWSQRQATSALVQLVTEANDRQTTCNDLYRAELNEQAEILELLNVVQEKKGRSFSKSIVDITKQNDSSLAQLESLLKGHDEQKLYNSLRSIAEEKRGSLNVFFQLVEQEKYDEALMYYKNNLKALYPQIFHANIQLLNYVVKKDKAVTQGYKDKITFFAQLNFGIIILILIVLTSLGLFIFKIIKKSRKANLDLKESERKYRTFIEQTNEMIEKCDANGKFVFANDFFRKRLEYDEEELSKLTLSDILAEGIMDINPDMAKDKVITNVQKIFKSKSGKRIYIEGTILLEYKEGEFDGAIGFFKDVTERKVLEESLIASELKFRNFFNLAPIPMWAIDPQTNHFVLVNKAAIEHYGFSKDEFLNMTIFEIRSVTNPLKQSKDIQRIKEETLELAEDKTGKYNINHVKKNGEEINVEIYTTPLIINDNKCILAIVIDVTERNDFENKITKAIIKTQEDERYEIGSELHDNVCQILAAAKMSLGTIKHSLDDDVMPSYNKSCNSILLATNEIRNLSHRLAPAFFDNTKLDEAFESLLNTFNIGDKYNISMHFDEHMKNISIDQDLQLNFYRILQEQLRNIIKHSGCTDIEVDVFVFNNQLQMRIADNGIGFEANQVKKGIGFANMKRRAELFGGKFRINTRPGKGCEIMIIIPISKTN